MRQAGIFGSAAFLWPAMIFADAGRLASALAQNLVGLADWAEAGERGRPLHWATRNEIVLELPSLRLRDFSTGAEGLPTLVCAPFALHGSNIADFARDHSLVGVLRSAGIHRLFVIDWRSATPEMRFFTIDSFLADLNVAIDELGGRVDLIGICQGGWLGLVYAARFPHKVRKIVIAGAPIDVAAADSPISAAAKAVALSVFEDLVELGQGRVIGERVLELWGSLNLSSQAIREILQLDAECSSRVAKACEARFRDWYATTVDLPGAYYLQVVQWLFKENRLAEGRFMALGRRIDLSTLRVPVFLLAARNDEFVAPGQVFAAARHLGTKPASIRQVVAPGSHMALFMGSVTLTEIWPRIIRWLRSESGRESSVHRKIGKLP